MTTGVGAAPILEARAISKRFGGALALDDVSLSVAAGEIHAVVGENGAGKSTLMRIMAGIISPDSGTVQVGGRPLEGGPRAAIDAGVALVHQELSLVPEMTVAENILLGDPPTTAGFTRTKKLKAIAQAALDEIGVSVDLDEPIARLSVSLRQFVEIARAVARNPRVLILDEPTATLTPAETDYLLAMLQRLAAKGMAIVYISHRIPEVFAICTAVTILRDGRLVERTDIATTSPSAVIDAMVGRELKLDQQIRRTATPGEVVLSARGIRAHNVNGVDLDVRAGEIVGLGGLVGAGRTELVRAIIGADPRSAGNVTMTVDGRRSVIGGYQSAVRAGIGYVPEERRVDGLALTMSVADNVALPNRAQLSTGSVLRRRATDAFVRRLADVVGLRPPEITREVGEYSGGNQQKVVIAKWLGRKPDLIVLDEPTRGVDVGAKSEIYSIIDNLAKAGTAILVISSDLPEIIGICDRVVVMRAGQIAGEVTRGPNSALAQEDIMALATGMEHLDA